jgi:trigger factor
MQIEVNELEACKLSVHYEANALEIMDKRAEVQNAFKKAPVPGFRQGKPIPMDAIKMHYRQQIDESLKRVLAEDAFHNTLFEKKLRPHGAPKFNSLLLDGGKFTCDFEIYTKPDFELAPFQEMEVVKPREALQANEVAEQMMQELRVRLGDVAPYSDTDFVENGDNIIIDYEGSIDGVKTDNLCASGEMVTIGSNQITDFDPNLLGMTSGETREFDIRVSESSLPSIAGKTVHFQVTLVTGAKTTPCPLTDELAVKMGKKDFAELRQQVQVAADVRVANSFKMSVHDAVAKRLVADNTINVPNWMSLSEARYLAHQSQLDWDTIVDADKEKFLEMAVKNVKLSLILDAIRDKEVDSQLSDQEVFEVIKKNLSQTKIQKPLDEVIQEMNRTGYLQILFSRIRDEHTMDFVVKSVKVIGD